MRKILTLVLLLSFFQLYSQTQLTLLANWDDNTLPVKSDLTYNDCWGYASPSGREYAIMGSLTKVHFFEIASSGAITLVAEFTNGANSIWRDFKTYGNFVYASADEGTEGLLVFNVSNIDGTSNRVTQIYQDNTTFQRCHNIFLDVPNKKLYCAGTNTVNGLYVYDINPTTGIPTLCAQVPMNNNGFSSGYIHDIHVKNAKLYCSHGNNGLRIYNGTSINNWQTGNPVITTLPILGTNNFAGSGYNHSSWLNSSNTHLIMAEETHGKPLKIIDVSDPTQIGNFSSPTSTFQSCMLCPGSTTSIVHNPFVKGNYVYLAYYHEGVQIYDISNVNAPVKVGFYDTFPSNTNYSGFYGSWGVYPYLPSQKIIASDINNGLFVLGLPAALPASLVNFDGKKTQEGVLLQWRTATESPSMTFEVQKSSTGDDFKTFSSQRSKKIEGANYSQTDKSPTKGKNYYRLKKIDQDGTFEYSNIISVDYDIEPEIKIFPNPSHLGSITIDLGQKNIENTTIIIMDSQGKVVQSIETVDQNQIKVNNLIKGFYTVKINNSYFEKTNRVIIID